jgi:uncharacterized C2H2 Zn-finger protein
MTMKHWDTPEGYQVSSYCPSCGKDFSGDKLFDRHRTGIHAYSFSEDVPVGGRRCKTTEELLEDGMRPMTEEEMKATTRHNHRVGFGVEMWFDPVATENARNRFNG